MLTLGPYFRRFSKAMMMQMVDSQTIVTSPCELNVGVLYCCVPRARFAPFRLKNTQWPRDRFVRFDGVA